MFKQLNLSTLKVWDMILYSPGQCKLGKTHCQTCWTLRTFDRLVAKPLRNPLCILNTLYDNKKKSTKLMLYFLLYGWKTWSYGKKKNKYFGWKCAQNRKVGRLISLWKVCDNFGDVSYRLANNSYIWPRLKEVYSLVAMF